MKSAVFAFLVIVHGAAYAAVATLDIEALIDGRSRLALQGSNAQWFHYDYDRPGQWQGRNEPTRFSSTLNGSPVMTSVDWVPAWNGNTSDSFTAIAPPLGTSGVSLDAIVARHSLWLVQSPEAANNYTTIIEFNDNPPGGAAWYTARLTYEAVPEPATMAALGLGAIALVRRRRRA